MSFRIFLPTQNNRNLPSRFSNNTKVDNKILQFFNDNEISLPTEKELHAFNEIFLSLKALNDFSKLSNEISKNCFINQLINKHIHMSDFIFMKLTLKNDTIMLEAENPSTVIDEVKKKMNALITKHQKKEDDLKKKAHVTKSKQSTKQKQHIQQSATTDLFEQHKLHTTKAALLSIENTRNLTFNKDIHDIQIDENYPWYSMIHSLFEPFDFIVYSGSHLMKGDSKVHEITKLKLQFPKDKNFMILFHGKLLHSGAPALPESDAQSFNYRKSLRLFSYINKKPSTVNESTSTSTMMMRSKEQKEHPKGILYKVDTKKKTCGFCNSCIKELQSNDKYKYWSHMASNGCGSMVLDILSCYNHKIEKLRREKKKEQLDKHRLLKKQLKSVEDGHSAPQEKASKRRKVTEDKPTPILVAGNLEADGWAVYEGVDVSNHEKYMFLENQLRDSMKKPFVSAWNSIHSDKNSATSRDILKLHEIVKAQTIEKIKVINSFFHDIHNSVIKKVNGFENASMETRSLLKNTNNVEEQAPHCDY
jgi:hypothetical protein